MHNLIYKLLKHLFKLMYEIYPANRRVERELIELLQNRSDILDKLRRLKEEPRRALDAHPLHGHLKGKWSCWLGYNLRMIYVIDDANKRIEVEAIGSHKIY